MLRRTALLTALVSGLFGFAPVLAAPVVLALEPAVAGTTVPCAPREIVGDVPFEDVSSTCGLECTVDEYGERCSIQGVGYPGPDLVYQLELTEGNEVGFSLDLEGSTGDLVLVLLEDCGDGTSCVVSSPDFIGAGAGPEEIAAASYDPGTYFLYVDSASTEFPCGTYRLRITGVNPPEPDLSVALAADSGTPGNPAIAGERTTLRLSVINDSPFSAIGVEATVELPAELTVCPACTLPGSCLEGPTGTVRCSIGEVPRKALLAERDTEVKREIEVLIDPAVNDGARLQVEASVTASQPDPDTGNDQTSLGLFVRRQVNLEVRKSDRPDPVIAGRSLTYFLSVTNAGPSNASGVAVTDVLPGAVAFVSARGCSPPEPGGRTVVCGLGELPRGSTSRQLLVVVRVPSSTAENAVIVNTAQASSQECAIENPECQQGARVETTVRRQTDLAVKVFVLEPRVGAVVAGEEIVYALRIFNQGDSDASGVRVTDTLPPGVGFLSASESCEARRAEEGRIEVECSLGEVASGSGRSIELRGGVAPSLLPGTSLVNVAVVEGEGEDPDEENNSSQTVLDVRTEANLMITKEADLELATAGNRVAYRITVANLGPSDARDVVVADLLQGPDEEPAQLDLAFTIGCLNDSDRQPSCSLGTVPAGTEAEFLLVAKVREEALQQEILNSVTVVSSTELRNPDNEAETMIQLPPQVDLAITKRAFPDPVATGDDLTYELTVINQGTLKVQDVQVIDRPPGGVTFEASEDCSPNLFGEVTCSLDQLALAEERTLTFTVTLDEVGEMTNRAEIVTSFPKEDFPGDESVALETEVVEELPEGLILGKEDLPDPVLVGGRLTYTLTVTNPGPTQVDEGTLIEELPAGAEAVEVPESCEEPEAGSEAGTSLTCPLGEISSRSSQRLVFQVRDVEGTRRTLVNRSRITFPGPQGDGLTATEAVEETVVAGPPLVLPYFRVVQPPSPAGRTTLFVVRNETAERWLVKVDFLDVAGEPSRPSRLETLEGRASLAVNLRDVSRLDPDPATGAAVGSVALTPYDLRTGLAALGRRVLHGHLLRVGPKDGSASGNPLVATAPPQAPPELCSKWNVRFFPLEPPAAETELVFFVPENAGVDGPVVTGTVYDETGSEAAPPLEILDGNRIFTRRVRENLGVESAAIGTIAWQFREGLKGNISAIYRSAEGTAVEVPGSCEDRPGTQPLRVPFFDLGDGAPGATVRVSVYNETAEQLPVTLDCVSPQGDVLCAQQLSLPPHGTRLIDLADVLVAGAGQVTGYVEVSSGGPNRPGFSGEYFVIDSVQGRAIGGNLADTLCRSWAASFVAGEDRDTGFVFFLPENPGGADAAVTGKVFGQSGEHLQQIEFTTSDRAFSRSARDLGFPMSGSVEWDFVNDLHGHVSTVFRAGTLSALVEASCRDIEVGP